MERVEMTTPDFIAIDWRIDIAGDRTTAQVSFVLLPTDAGPGPVTPEVSPRIGFRYVELKRLHAFLGGALEQMLEKPSASGELQ